MSLSVLSTTRVKGSTVSPVDPLWPLSLFHLITFLSAMTLNPPTPRVLHVSPCVAAFSSWYLEPTLPQYKPVTHLVQSSPTATSQVDSRSWIQLQLHPPHMHLLLCVPQTNPSHHSLSLTFSSLLCPGQRQCAPSFKFTSYTDSPLFLPHLCTQPPSQQEPRVHILFYFTGKCSSPERRLYPFLCVYMFYVQVTL